MTTTTFNTASTVAEAIVIATARLGVALRYYLHLVCYEPWQPVEATLLAEIYLTGIMHADSTMCNTLPSTPTT